MCVTLRQGGSQTDHDAYVSRRNACDVLMESSREVILPPVLNGKNLRSDQRLYNDLLGKPIIVAKKNKFNMLTL